MDYRVDCIQNYIYKMQYQTPMKRREDGQDDKGTSLKNAINQRLSQTTFKNKYCRHQQQSDHKSCNALTEQLQLIRKLTEYQSKSSVGYFKFDDWVSFNQAVFPHVKSDVVKQLWKIMRIVNYGEVLIPTGLIYQISHRFAIGSKQIEGNTTQMPQIDRFDRKTKIKAIINEFLSLNGVSDTISNFRQLSNYMSLQEIQSVYISKYILITDKFYSHKQKVQVKTGEVFNRCFKDAKKRQQFLIKLKYASLIQETKQCNFKPTIKRYESNHKLSNHLNTDSIHKLNQQFNQCSNHKSINNISSSNKCLRVCHQKDKYNYQNIQNYNEMINCGPLFKAKPIDPQIYNKNIEAIPGVSEHIMRKKVSQQEKQRLIRQSLRPGKWNAVQSVN